MLVAVIAYALLRYCRVNNFLLKTIIVYVPTMLLVFLYVFLRGLTVELAKTAYRDIFIKAIPHNSECGIAPSDFSSDSTKRPQAG